MNKRPVLAIDFGTSNSFYSRCPADKIASTCIDFCRGGDGITTAVLYRDDRSTIVGDEAIETYGDSTEEDRKTYTFRSHFKPDVAVIQEARKHAVVFLSGILEDPANQSLHLDPAEHQVIFGVPCQSDEQYKQTLRSIACEAGYGDVKLAEEPRGALLFHVSQKDMSSSDALGNVLVVDFGGGTCDFAYMKNGRVSSAWGDMELGGRLFDDLFYQWFTDANPGAVEQISANCDEHFMMTNRCRKVKEAFSRVMARDRDDLASKVVGNYGRLSKMSWSEFVERAGSYRPSKVFKDNLVGIGANHFTLLDCNEPVDLIGWFRDALREGLASNSVDPKDIQHVILAGGSSLWPFVPEILSECFFVTDDRIRRSDRPYAVISMGLSMGPALDRQMKETLQVLKDGLPAFLSDHVGPLIEERLYQAAEDLSEAIVIELFDNAIGPHLEKFREQGGCVKDLKEDIRREAEAFEPRIAPLVEQHVQSSIQAIPPAIHGAIVELFKENRLSIPRPSNDARAAVVNVLLPDISAAADIYEDVSNIAIGVSAIVGGIITAAICGGAGMALIASGPIGWIIGLVVGAGATGVALIYGTEKAKAMVEEMDISPLVVKFCLSEKKIKQARTKLKSELQNLVIGQFNDVYDQLREQAKSQIEAEIHALSDLSQL